MKLSVTRLDNNQSLARHYVMQVQIEYALYETPLLPYVENFFQNFCTFCSYVTQF